MFMKEFTPCGSTAHVASGLADRRVGSCQASSAAIPEGGGGDL